MDVSDGGSYGARTEVDLRDRLPVSRHPRLAESTAADFETRPGFAVPPTPSAAGSDGGHASARQWEGLRSALPWYVMVPSLNTAELASRRTGDRAHMAWLGAAGHRR
jgi:hypothetical protein